MASSEPEYPQGATVPVLYLPDAPEEGRIGLFSELWLGSWVSGLVTVLLRAFTFVAWHFEL
ncbi:hypothetical protein A176_007043 [Myxococcus hansupus]|uniref:Uncharacterized protein n=1 Tax=Pseudomyxococcus hansupus TaxID=1297742 RepID=A0A0H4X3A7_9BACT|nr:DUF3592 domain-containing protein [Myxococcus hansupus]AKQ70131.1 hypothetical protein A176_007043 [Myxococcus hansupus]